LSEKYPHLKNAPIKEALIDIQVVLPTSFSIGDLKSTFLSKVSEKGFPSVQGINQIEIQGGKAQDNLFSSSKETLLGYRFSNKDNTKVIQARSNGYTFSHLQPYSRWDDFLEEAKLFWQIYCELTKPEKLTRLATRFINIIDPIDSITTVQNLGTVFKSAPTLPPLLPSKLENCFSRFVVSEETQGFTTIITQAFEHTEPGKDHVVLDIDVFKEFPNGVEDKQIWAVLAKMRDQKNQVFFECLSEKVIERFK